MRHPGIFLLTTAFVATAMTLQSLIDATLPAGGSLAAHAQVAPPDPCTLLTTDDLQSVTGQPFGPGQGQTFPPTAFCDYSANPYPVVRVSLTTGETPATFAQLESVSCTGDALDGIGDAACSDQSGGIYFLKNGLRVLVAYNGSVLQHDDILALTRPLATLAASRL